MRGHAFSLILTGMLVLAGRSYTGHENLMTTTTAMHLAIRQTTNQCMAVEIEWPIDFTNRLELFSTTNLMSADWTLACTDILSEGFSSFIWLENPPAAHSKFYIAANADRDTDGDRVSDAQELFIYGTTVDSSDSDRDGMDDGYEVRSRLLNPLQAEDAVEDWDLDGLSNLQEYHRGTAIDLADTDGDCFADGFEIDHGFDPVNPLDPDRVFLSDQDADGMADIWELYCFGTSEAHPSDNPDGDAWSNGMEYLAGADPYREDTDGDGIRDDQDASPLRSGPRIIFTHPGAGERIAGDPLCVQGEVLFGGDLNSLLIDGQTATLQDRGDIWLFSASTLRPNEGVQTVHAVACGSRSGEELFGEAALAVDVAGPGPELVMTSISDGATVSNLYVHFSIRASEAAAVSINGVSASIDGYLHYAWAELTPGQNTVLVTATDTHGDVTTETIEIFCEVPPGHTELPPVDADQDGVLDVNDYAPLDATMHSPISITSIPNGAVIHAMPGPSSVEQARSIMIAGAAQEGVRRLQVHLRSLHGTWGADWKGSIEVVSGNFAVPVQLFPGLNRITLVAGKWSESIEVTLKVQQSHLDRADTQPVTDVLTMLIDKSGSYREGRSKDGARYVNGEYAYAGIYAAAIERNSFQVSDYEPYEPQPYAYTVQLALDGDVVLSRTGMRTAVITSQVCSTWFDRCTVKGYWLADFLSFVVHSGDYAGGYVVENGYRTLCPQGYDPGAYVGSNDVFYDAGKQIRFESVVLNGPTGSASPVYLPLGQSAQFSLEGIRQNEVAPEGLYGGYHLHEPAGIGQAVVDVMGVFSALTPGRFRVGIGEKKIRRIDGSYFSTNDIPAIEVQVFEPPVLVPDYGRDGVTDPVDAVLAVAGEPVRWWVNDDDDAGDVAVNNSDLPGQGGLLSRANYQDGRVNGRCDLLDFFPVWLDMNEMLTLFPHDAGVEYRLRHEDAAVRVVYTDLTNGQANAFLRTEGHGYGPALMQEAHEADSLQVTDSGIALTATFLDRVAADPNKGVVLVEGIKKSFKPLLLEVWKGGQKLAESRLELSLAGVEDMYRWINLRGVAGGSTTRATDLAEPANLPDTSGNGKNFIFAHGYNVSEEAARAWNSEVFKRLHQAGSNARFHAVTWYGNQSQFHMPLLGSTMTPDYHVNVVNALNSAWTLKTYIDGLDGESVVAAHSLGNILVGSAVARWDADVATWFMMNGAVAIESFDGSASAQDSAMVHPEWLTYHERLSASEWHELFGSGDYRTLMTWRDYFADALSKTYNFYSSGEQVLDTHEGDPGLIDAFSGEGAWCLQEKRKGRNWISSVGGSTYGGWGFNETYDIGQYAGGGHMLLTDDQLMTHAFFRPGDDGLQDLYDPIRGNDFAGNYMYELLAGFVPSRTLPCGANRVEMLNPPTLPDRNYNMDTMENGWPTERCVGDYGNRWLHSDIKSVAYPYVYRVFNEFVIQGELR